MASEGQNQPGLSLFLPFLLGFAARHQLEQDSSRRVVLFNPSAQSMLVIGSGDGFFNGLSGKEGPPPASKASIEAMPTVEAKGEERGECVICLEEWETGKEMPCGHRFHGECIERWLGMHGNCPVCRFSMPVDDESEKKKEDARGAEGGGIWITWSLDFRNCPAEQSNEIRSDSATEDSISSPVGETEN